MNICIVGWYLYEDFYRQAKAAEKHYPAIVVSHRVGGNYCGLPFIEIPNIGLEFGAYDYYLKNMWDAYSDVLFLHDDSNVSSVGFFDECAALKEKNIDQSFIFSSDEQARNNQKFHGRCFYCSARFLKHMASYACDCGQAVDYIDMHHNKYCSVDCIKAEYPAIDELRIVTAEVGRSETHCGHCRQPIPEGQKFYGQKLKGTGPHSGFWFDPWNTGHNSGKPPIGVRHYNDGVYHFVLYCGRMAQGRYGEKYNSGGYITIPTFTGGKRGKFYR
jgi:hypothetical protein